MLEVGVSAQALPTVRDSSSPPASRGKTENLYKLSFCMTCSVRVSFDGQLSNRGLTASAAALTAGSSTREAALMHVLATGLLTVLILMFGLFVLLFPILVLILGLIGKIR